MTPSRQLILRHEAADPADLESARLYRAPGFAADPTVAACHAIAGWAMAYLGPVFWICLAYLFLVAELGR
jgi:hypothetical protein